MEGLAVVDSATQLDASARGMVAVCGSHGALYAAWLAANARVRAVILNDAGIGKHSAGVAGAAGLGGPGVPGRPPWLFTARLRGGGGPALKRRGFLGGAGCA